MGRVAYIASAVGVLVLASSAYVMMGSSKPAQPAKPVQAVAANPPAKAVPVSNPVTELKSDSIANALAAPGPQAAKPVVEPIRPPAAIPAKTKVASKTRPRSARAKSKPPQKKVA
jgi:hypothetical protein